MYYRVAIQVDSSPTWKWKSPALNWLNILFHWFQYYRAVPHDRLRIFSSSSQEDLNEQLVRENQGLMSTSIPAIQFLQEGRIAPQEVVREASAGGTRANERTASIATLTEPSPYESSSSPLDKRREELELGAGAVMTSHTASPYLHRCRKSSPGCGCLPRSSVGSFSPRSCWS